MVTFAVSDVDRPKQARPALEWEASVRSLLKVPVEALSPSTRRLVACTDANPLAQAAHDAFYDHVPLVLTPDAVWFCLAQGFARHVNANVEALRERFVTHQGKAKLTIEHLGIELGRPSPWHEAFAMFSDQLAWQLGKKRDLVVAAFSTTGPIERAASEILLMDAFQGYFEYEMRCGCGIPEITLLGTPADWRSIRQRAQVLGEYGLSSWLEVLLPVLDRLVATAEGKIDVEGWRSFFHYQSGSMGTALTGWILALFPYLDSITDWRSNLRTPVWNRYLETCGREANEGPSLLELPSGLASAPVKYVDVRRPDQPVMLRFVAGMMGVVQDERTLALQPEFGWSVVHEPEAAPRAS